MGFFMIQTLRIKFDLHKCTRVGLRPKKSECTLKEKKGKKDGPTRIKMFTQFYHKQYSFVWREISFCYHEESFVTSFFVCLSHQALRIPWSTSTEDGRSMRVCLLYGQLSQGRMADFPAFIASKSFDLWNHHIPQMNDIIRGTF